MNKLLLRRLRVTISFRSPSLQPNTISAQSDHYLDSLMICRFARMKPSCTSLRVHEEKPSLGFSWRSEVIPHGGHRGSALAAAQTRSCALESVPALYSSLQKGLRRGKYQPEFSVVFENIYIYKCITTGLGFLLM